MALPMVAMAGMTVAQGFLSYMGASRAEDAAETNLYRARLQAQLYDQKAARIEYAASVEGDTIYRKAGEIGGKRNVMLAARGISLNSQIAEAFNEQDQAQAFSAVATLTANAALDSASLRTTGRLGVEAAQEALDNAGDAKSWAFVSGLIPGASQILGSKI